VSAYGHEIARQQIAGHGKDRYPTGWRQVCKVRSELRELTDEMRKAGFGAKDGQVNSRIKAEYADVGLSLYELGNKLGIDLIDCMRDLVAADTRSFS
jgi:hypothetical protein